MSENMISSIKQHGASSVERDENFRNAFARLQTTDPQEAARVQIELDNWHQANKPPASSSIDDDEIPY